MLQIRNIKVEPDGDGYRLCGQINCKADRRLDGQEVWWSSSQISPGVVSHSADPFVAALLLPSMRLGLPLHVEGTISIRLRSNLKRIMELLHGWWPEMKIVEVQASGHAEAANPPSSSRGRASFFSGGVDAFYTLLDHTARAADGEPRLTHMVFVRGFDIHLSRDHAIWNKALANAREVARETSLKLVTLSTNIRQLGNPIVQWDNLHGACLGSVALALQETLGTIYIPSSPRRENAPWGSHPMLDPLWSNEDIEVIYDNRGGGRLHKVLGLADSDLALKYLRVCHENPLGAFNCGKCEKCIRTMVELRVAGAMDRCHAFAVPLDLGRVSRMFLHNTRYAMECLEELQRTNRDLPLQRAIEESIRRSDAGESPWRRQARHFRSSMRNGLARLDDRCFAGALHRLYRRLLHP